MPSDECAHGTPRVPPTEVTLIEIGKGTRLIEREPTGECDCGGFLHFIERTTGNEFVGTWPEIAPEAEARWDETERYVECNKCHTRVWP